MKTTHTLKKKKKVGGFTDLTKERLQKKINPHISLFYDLFSKNTEGNGSPEKIYYLDEEEGKKIL